MSRLLTKNPVAIRQLMSEAIFSLPSEESVTIAGAATVLRAEVTPVVGKAAIPLVFWGGNTERILFFVRHASFDYFSKEAEEAFLKTLTALKLSLEEVAVVNLNKTSKTIDEIKEQLHPKCCIYCEGETSEASSTFNVLEKAEVDRLYTYSFEEMLSDPTKKRLFWNAIKEIKQ